MPIPLIRLRPSGLETQRFVERRDQRTLKEKRNEVTACLSRRANHLVNGQGRRFKRYLCTKFCLCYGLDPFSNCFLVSNDAARDMPSPFVIPIITPSQQRLVPLILNEQVHVNHGRDPADKQKGRGRPLDGSLIKDSIVLTASLISTLPAINLNTSTVYQLFQALIICVRTVN